jgi:hypothetical protein
VIGQREYDVGLPLTVWSEAGSGTEIELTIAASIVYAAAGARRAIFGKMRA